MTQNNQGFSNPPIVELVLGVQFSPLMNFSAGHLGWFWKKYLSDDWSKSLSVPAISDQFERFDNAQGWNVEGLRLLLGGVGLPGRLQITTVTGEHMIQIQPTRFHYNWQKRDQAYPRYENVFRDFEKSFALFSQFVHDAKELGRLAPNQWEIIYINHVPQGKLWQSPSDWSEVFPGLFPKTDKIIGIDLENFAGEWHYVISPKQGRLHIATQHGLVGDKPTPVLVTTFTARGPIGPDDGMADWRAGLDVGHHAITQSFLQLSSEKAKIHWRGE
jgi:uncharacterized protein (TIGR04255 family)